MCEHLHVCVHVYACIYTGMWTLAWVDWSITLIIVIIIIINFKVSHLTWSSLTQLDWLANWRFIHFSLPPPCLDFRCALSCPSFLNAFWGFDLHSSYFQGKNFYQESRSPVLIGKIEMVLIVTEVSLRVNGARFLKESWIFPSQTLNWYVNMSIAIELSQFCGQRAQRMLWIESYFGSLGRPKGLRYVHKCCFRLQFTLEMPQGFRGLYQTNCHCLTSESNH